VRKHNPWSDFPALPARVGQPFTRFPRAYRRLPAISFVIPNLDHDMHDGTVDQADSWLRNHLRRYARWARTHRARRPRRPSASEYGPPRCVVSVPRAGS
jgi:acid phosphatase